MFSHFILGKYDNGMTFLLYGADTEEKVHAEIERIINSEGYISIQAESC